MDTNYKKHTQKDYSLSLKLQIVQEIQNTNRMFSEHLYGVGWYIITKSLKGFEDF